MSLLGKVTDFAKGLMHEAEKAASRITSHDSFERVCQAAFLIGRADGAFGRDEKAALAKIIGMKLPQFKAADIIKVIDESEDQMGFSVEGGIQMLLANIANAKGSNEAPLIMLTVCAVGNADGTFDDDEKGQARKIAEALGLDASAYGL